ncbi:hypothetical protein ACS0PU_001697 [Formica fusca]
MKIPAINLHVLNYVNEMCVLIRVKLLLSKMMYLRFHAFKILSRVLPRDCMIRVHLAMQIRFGARIIEFVALHMTVVNQAVQIGNRFRNRVCVFVPRIIRRYRNWS